jgi:HNH endonuclease
MMLALYNGDMKTMLEDLRSAAKPYGLQVKECGFGHIQIHGKGLLVNYYPGSKKQSAYVSGTTRRYNHVSPARAIQMALEPPPMATADRKQQRKNYRNIKTALFRKNEFFGKPNVCHWCKVVLTLDTGTIDHLIPLARGGLDNANNRVLACESCNRERGCDMPELKKAQEPSLMVVQ